MTFKNTRNFAYIIATWWSFPQMAKGATPIHIKDVAAEVLTHARGIKASQANLAAAKNNLSSVKSERCPTLDLESNVGYIGRRPKLDAATDAVASPWQSSIGLGLNWNIWDGGRIGAREDSNNIEVKRIELESLVKTHEHLRDAAAKFLELYQSLNSIKNHSEKTQLLLRQKETIERKVKNGLAPEVNLIEIEGLLQKHDAQGLVARRSLQAARSGLALTIGSPTIKGTAIDQIQSVDLTNFKPPTLFTQKDTFEAKLHELQETADKAKLREIQLEHGPQVGIGAGINWGTNRFVGTGAAPDRNQELQSSVNLSLKYQLWDSGQRSHKQEAILESQKASRINREQSKAESAFKIDDLFAAAESLAAQKNVNKALLRIETRRFEVIEQNYRRGTQSYLELITALDSLSSAKQALDDVLVAEQLNFVQLHYLAGDIYDVVMAP